VRIGVDQLGRAREGRVAGDDLAAQGREQVADGLDRLDDSERRELSQAPTDVRQLHEDDVAELSGRVIRDADRRLVAVDPDPLMVFRVAQILGDHRGCLLHVGDESAAPAGDRRINRCRANDHSGAGRSERGLVAGKGRAIGRRERPGDPGQLARR
jgi:hypothetical protein